MLFIWVVLNYDAKLCILTSCDTCKCNNIFLQSDGNQSYVNEVPARRNLKYKKQACSINFKSRLFRLRIDIKLSLSSSAMFAPNFLYDQSTQWRSRSNKEIYDRRIICKWKSKHKVKYFTITRQIKNKQSHSKAKVSVVKEKEKKIRTLKKRRNLEKWRGTKKINNKKQSHDKEKKSQSYWRKLVIGKRIKFIKGK